MVTVAPEGVLVIVKVSALVIAGAALHAASAQSTSRALEVVLMEGASEGED
jgi:hypothetical protein